MRTRYLLLLGYCLLFSGKILCQGFSADTLLIYASPLQEVSVTAEVPKPPLKTMDGVLEIDMKGLDILPKFLGAADPVRFLQTLAGIQVNNETTAGIYLQGCDEHQTELTIDEAPVYYPNHLLGLFSAFIPTHFERMDLTKSMHDAAFGDFLGGEIKMYPYTDYSKKIGIEGNVGLIGSDLTVPMQFSNGHQLRASARSSYMGWLYKPFLRNDNTDLKYEFQDFNLTYSHCGDKDKLLFTAYYGMDNMEIYQPITVITMGANWDNMAASFSWEHDFADCILNCNVFASGFRNHIEMDESSVYAQGDSYLYSSGSHINLITELSENMTLQTGVDYLYYWNSPLSLSFSGLRENMQEADRYELRGHEGALYADIEHDVVDFFSYNLGLRGTAWICENRNYWSLDPRMTFRFVINPLHKISLHYGLYHQYLHKAGLTDGGLPSDFFFLSSVNAKPEYAHSISLGYEANIKSGTYSFSSELYFKQLYNVLEARANIFDIALRNTFDYRDYLMLGKGRNYGLNIMFQKNKGIIKGYLSYSLSWAMRNFDELGEGYLYRAGHDRRHSLVAVANYRPHPKWSFGGVFTLASGTPYTRIKHIYILNQQVVCEYDDYNKATLPLYHRLDLSAEYSIFKKKDKELAVNLSLYNVYAHRNVQYIVLNRNMTVKEISYINTIIPSVSVYFRF